MEHALESQRSSTTGNHARGLATVLILLADTGLLAWSAMAALLPGYLLGPEGKPIVAAGYEGFTTHSWADLAASSPETVEFMTLLFRLFGSYGVALSLLAIAVTVHGFRRAEPWAWWVLLVANTIAFAVPMTYDWTVDAIGPFEMTEYVGIGAIYLALALTAPFLGARSR